MTLESVARLRSDFETAASNDGVIDEAEAKTIIRRVRSGRLTESEAKALRGQMVKFSDAFDPQAKAVFEAFKPLIRRNTYLDPRDGPPPNPYGVADPVVLKADIDRLEQQVVPGGELFRNGISAKDPEQLYLGDCYLMAAMSAVAHMQPDVIRNAFTKTGANTYAVALYTSTGRRKNEHIDADLPRNGWYGYYYARAHDPKELWPALLEKAAAVRAGSYEGLNGGLSGDAMEMLTGKKSVDTLTRGNRMTADKMFATIKDAVDNKKPITASTYGASTASKYTGTGMHADHTYVVLDCETIGGVQFVKLRNPWGNGEPDGNGRDDGIFRIDIKSFMRLAWGISVNG